ncbi:MAG TPA: carbohydrate binding family 9 domain-containing protein, partial [Candidatus Brocadiia bacterium]|nr:carbohydrate binding family 9 domain-containing protein [Candidatus Brocadiia bacterium]
KPGQRVRLAFQPQDQTPPAPPLLCPVADAAPNLDGRLDDPVWARAARIEGLMNHREPASPASQKTEILLCHDTASLYLGFRCMEPQMANLKAAAKDHDGPVFADDSIEIFLDTRNDEFNFVQLAFNAAGVRFDQRCAGSNNYGANVFGVDYERKRVRDTAWNPDWTVKTTRHADRWEAEVAIPFKTLGRDSDLWGANFGRNRHAGESETSAWKVFGSFHQPEKFGKLLLTGARDGKARITAFQCETPLFGLCGATLHIQAASPLTAKAVVDTAAGAKDYPAAANGAVKFSCPLDETARGLTFIAAAGPVELCRIHTPARVPPPMQTLNATRVLSTAAPAGRLDLSLQVAASQRPACQLTCALLAPDGKQLDAAVTPIKSSEVQVALDLTGCPPGAYTLQFNLQTPNAAPLTHNEQMILIPHFLSAN